MIFFQVIRIYKRKRRVLFEGDSRQRAEKIYDKTAGPARDGDVVLYVDGMQERAFHGGYNRTRW